MEEFYLIDPPTTAGSEKGNRKTTVNTSGWPEIDLFSHWHRKIGYSALSSLLKKAWRKAPYDTIKLLFHLRNCHGKGERRQFYKGVRWFMEHHPDQIFANFQLIPQFGYWKDLLNIWDSKSELLRAYIIFAFCKQLEKDYQACGLGKQLSLAAKWAPTEKGAADRKWGFVGIFCEQLGWSRKIYRQRISQMRDELGVTERLASDQRWGEMDFSEIPAKSRVTLHQTLQKWCGKRYNKWCLKRQRQMNSEKAPYDIIANETIDSEWKELLQTYQGLSFKDTICVCDTSPSMDHSSGGSPLNVALALTMLISTFSEEYRNKVISFSDTPEIIDIGGETPSQQIQNLKRLKWGYSIDIKAVLNLLVDRMPKQIFIFTDLGYKSAQFPYRFEWDYATISKDRKLPQIYFWNLGRWGSCSFDLEHHDKGLIIINGFTNEMFNAIIKTGQLYPWLLLRQLLSSEEYAKIKMV